MSNLIWIFIVFCSAYSQEFQDSDEARFANAFLQLQTLTQNNVVTTKVDVNELFLQMYSRANPNGIRVNLTDGSNVASLSSFDVNLETFVYVHGWQDTIDKPNSKLVKDSLLNASDVNVFLLCWETCSSSINYFTSKGCLEDTGNYLGEFLKDLQTSYDYSFDKITIVGHSLGAHIAGFAGKNTNGTLGVIVGLDPAGPFFFKDDIDARLTANDAQYVQSIHTCGTGIVGISYNVGDADFWPNGGALQPGCGIDELKCPHLRSIEYYAESISSDGFVGCNCTSYNDYKQGNCDDVDKRVMGGLNVDKEAHGTYYLDTNSQSPFAKGDV